MTEEIKNECVEPTDSLTIELPCLMIERIEKLAWWETPLQQIEEAMQYFTVPLTTETMQMLESRIGDESGESKK